MYQHDRATVTRHDFSAKSVDESALVRERVTWGFLGFSTSGEIRLLSPMAGSAVEIPFIVTVGVTGSVEVITPTLVVD